MEFVAAKCPNCAGELRLPDDQKRVKCMYCGYDILVREAINAAGVNVENLLRLAISAEETGNPSEAYKYFTQILEFEPENSLALLGKGVAAGFLSTSHNFRSEELLKGVREAIEKTSEPQRDNLKAEAAEKIHKVCDAFQVDNSSDESKLQRYRVAQALQFAHDLAPANVEVLTSLYFQYRFMQIQTEGTMRVSKLLMKEQFDSSTFDKLIASEKSQINECLNKIEALNPERAQSLRASAAKATERTKPAVAQNGSGCLVMVVGMLILLVLVLVLL